MDDNLSIRKRQLEEWLHQTQTPRHLSERDRDYTDLKQWTDEEIAILNSRGQAPVVFDYIREQLDYFVSLERDNRTDPKAYPRTREHADAATAITDALRFVGDNNRLPQIRSEVFENMIVEGYGAAIVEVDEINGDFVIDVKRVPWDRFYFDPHSRAADFSDATFMGVCTWLDIEKVKEIYGDAAKDIEAEAISSGDDGSETLDDRPRWYEGKRQRLRVCQHYRYSGGRWLESHFIGDRDLKPERESPFQDEYGRPQCPIVARHAYIDRDNNRYGYVRRLIDPQKEINHRRSKALHLLSSSRIITETGAVKDLSLLRKELKKTDSVIEVNAGFLRDGSFQIDKTIDLAQGQISMYQDAVQKINKSGVNAAMQGDVDGMSGKAIGMLQDGGSIQIGGLFDGLREFDNQLYTQCWNRIRQFWDNEKWIRVTDNEDNLKWVGLNQPVTLAESLEEKAKQGDQQAAQLLQSYIQTDDPRLSDISEIRNNVAEIDVDIVISESADYVASQQEQFNAFIEMMKIYGADAVPFKAMIELSSINNKRKALEIIEGDEEQKAQKAQILEKQQALEEQVRALQMQKEAAETAKTEAEAKLKQAQALHEQARTGKTIIESEQAALVNQHITQFPDVEPTVIANT